MEHCFTEKKSDDLPFMVSNPFHALFNFNQLDCFYEQQSKKTMKKKPKTVVMAKMEFDIAQKITTNKFCDVDHSRATC